MLVSTSPTCPTCHSSGRVLATPDSGTHDVRPAHRDDPRGEPCPDCISCRHCLTRHDVDDSCPTCEATCSGCGRDDSPIVFAVQPGEHFCASCALALVLAFGRAA
jgi:hypothetical protein